MRGFEGLLRDCFCDFRKCIYSTAMGACWYIVCSNVTDVVGEVVVAQVSLSHGGVVTGVLSGGDNDGVVGSASGQFGQLLFKHATLSGQVVRSFLCSGLSVSGNGCTDS